MKIKQRMTIFFSPSKVETNINENEIDDIFESIYATVISN